MPPRTHGARPSGALLAAAMAVLAMSLVPTSGCARHGPTAESNSDTRWFRPMTANVAFRPLVDSQTVLRALEPVEPPPGVDVSHRTDGVDGLEIVSEDIDLLRRWTQQALGELPPGTAARFERVPAIDIDGHGSPGERRWMVRFVDTRRGFVTAEGMAGLEFDGNAGRANIMLHLSNEDGRRFGELSEALVDEFLAIVVRGEVVSAPRVVEPIWGGRIRIDVGVVEDRDAELRALASELTGVPSAEIPIPAPRYLSAGAATK